MPVRPRTRVPPARRALLMAAAVLAAGCGGERSGAPPPAPRPNVLWVVWDTVRADHLSLYGYPRPTTPKLDAWAEGARVFEDAVSTASYTLPSHASMFTGLLPSEHCTHNDHPRLDDRFTTIAELLLAAGYRTFLYSANPQVAAASTPSFGQGFQVTEHPWSPRYREAALAAVEAKLAPEDAGGELPRRIAAARRGEAALTGWSVKAAGAIAERALLDWLDSIGGERPWFAFLNYMEAHRPYLAPRAYREQLLDEAAVRASYRVDDSWLATWEYSFGLRELGEGELALIRATYDATLRELDDRFARLLEALARRGALDDTVVILTSDHGEHLGEQHMLDHQHSLYQATLRVPLLIHYPPRLAPGRDPRPVMNFDLFPTVLELVGLPLPDPPTSRARSLLAPAERRLRLAEDPATSAVGVGHVRAAHPDWDPTPYRRRTRALLDERHKFVWGSDGRRELYDLALDPGENDDRLAREPETARRLEARLAAYHRRLAHCIVEPAETGPAPVAPAQRRLLEGLGYLAPEPEAPRP